MSYDIARNHWKYQTSWTDGFKCTHVKLQPKPSPRTSALTHRRAHSPSRTSKSTIPNLSPRSDSRSETGYSKCKTPTQMLDKRRENRVTRRKPWSEAPKSFKANRNVYTETYYESYLPDNTDLKGLKLQTRKYVTNSRYGNIYQVQYERNKSPSNSKIDEPSTWMWERDYDVWLLDQQRAANGKSFPMPPTYVTSVPKGVSVGHHVTRNRDGYCNISLKSSRDSHNEARSIMSSPRIISTQRSSTPSGNNAKFNPNQKPRLGKSVLDKPDAELFAHYNAYRLNKQERRQAAIKIQSLFRGYTVRQCLDRLKKKVVLDHGRTWRAFIDEYKQLISRIRSRYGIMRHSCAIVLKEVDNFMDTKYKYERQFDKTSVEGKLMKEDLGGFFENCKLYPTEEDIISTFNKIYHGTCCSAEVVFVLDCSTSIGALGFRRLIQFVKDVILSFDVAPDRVRVGVLPYNEDIFQSFSLFTYQSKHEILNAIDAIKLKPGLTRTHLAIREMNNMLSNSRPGVRKVGIVITDGKSSEPGYTEIEAKQAHSDGVNVFAIGIGGDVDTDELKTLTNSDDNIYTVGSYNTLSDLTEVLARSVTGKQEDSIESWKQGKCRPLNCTESMEILWTLYPPPAANLSHIHRSRWIRPVIQGTEAWSLVDDTIRSSTDLKSCLRVVIQARIERQGYVILPSLESSGVEYISDVDKAVSIIEDWMRNKQT